MIKALKHRNIIYGFCAVWIILFHVFRRISMPFIPVITSFVSLGSMAVDLFLFLSGMSLAISADRHQYVYTGWKEYFVRRLKRILIPYLIVGIPYYLWNSLAEHEGTIIMKIVLFIANISSANFWLRGTQTTWFVYAIILLYLVFPWLYQFLKKCGRGKVYILLAGMILFAVAASYLPILKNSVIVWARLPIFTLGILAGIYKDRSFGFRMDWILAIFVLLSLGWIVSMSEIDESISLPPVYRYILFIPMTAAAILVIQRLPEELKHVQLLATAGNLSLEMYLVHVTLLHPLKYYGVIDQLGYWLYLILPVITLPVAMAVGGLEKKIIKKD